MCGLFDGTPLERPVSCDRCGESMDRCACPRSASGEVSLPTDQPLRVSREKRAKGKVVTVVSGLDATASDRDAILKQLKAACGSGGAVKDGHIEVQGDHRERVMDALKILGYPVKMSGG